MRRFYTPLLCILLIPLLCGAAPEPPRERGDSYTADELAALDRALWGANLTRQDLRFDKDMAKGHACFPVVREMLDDPLTIAPMIEELVFYGNSMKRLRLSGAMWHAQHCFLRDLPPPVEREELVHFREGRFPRQFTFLDALHQASIRFAGSIAETVGTPKDQGAFLAYLETMLKRGNDPDADEGPGSLEPLLGRRNELLASSTWHPIDGSAKPGDSPDVSVFAAAAELDVVGLADHWALLFVYDSVASFAGQIDFPQDEPLILDTSYGRICLGTPGDDTYTGNFAVLIEPGGNDVYRNCRIGTAYGKPAEGLGPGHIGLFIDLGGDDLYDCADVDITLGAAVLGVAVFYDLGSGNDRYYGGNVSLGAAIGGVATFYDDGGSDFYSGKVYTQGAAAFGIAVMYDDSVQPAPDVPTGAETPDPIDLAAFDNDYYTAHLMAQAFARTRGVAICANTRGNEIYHAGGVYLHAPLFSDRYQSFSQGFAIGERGIDYAGGIALLADYDGNDRYLGDVYNQGVGYWYSAGFLYDGGGNDHYEMTQYGQGSGIHLAVGGLIDERGSDTYVMHSGLGQGGSHDYAASAFMDRGGDDRYLGNTSCNGTGLTNSVGLFFDRGGNDLYAARRGSINVGRPARGFGSIGALIDLGGDDDYLGPLRDDLLWLQPEFGVGIDVGPSITLEMVGQDSVPVQDGQQPTAGSAQASSSGQAGTPVPPSRSGFDTPSAELEMPAVIAYAGPLTQEVFDELWEIAIRWEVGDNRVIVPAARQRLIEFGPDVLPLVEAVMDDPNSLAVRAFNDVLRAFSFTEETAEAAESTESPARTYLATRPLVEALLTRQLTDASDDRKTAALRVTGDLKLEALGTQVAALLDHPDPAMQRRVVGVLGQIGSHAADERLLALLVPATDEALLKVVVEAVINLRLTDDRTALLLAPLLADPRFTVRDTLRTQLAGRLDSYGQLLSAFFSLSPPFSDDPDNRRMLRTMLRVYLSADAPPTEELLAPLDTHLHNPDSGVRADAALLVQHWGRLVAGTELAARFEGDGGLNARAAAVLAEAGMPTQLEH